MQHSVAQTEDDTLYVEISVHEYIRNREQELLWSYGALAGDRIWPTCEIGRVIYGDTGPTVASLVGREFPTLDHRASALTELCCALQHGIVSLRRAPHDHARSAAAVG